MLVGLQVGALAGVWAGACCGACGWACRWARELACGRAHVAAHAGGLDSGIVLEGLVPSNRLCSAFICPFAVQSTMLGFPPPLCRPINYAWLSSAPLAGYCFHNTAHP
eukprot:355366-Chlamydomonas_euryale.AAC.3